MTKLNGHVLDMALKSMSVRLDIGIFGTQVFIALQMILTDKVNYKVIFNNVFQNSKRPAPVTTTFDRQS